MKQRSIPRSPDGTRAVRRALAILRAFSDQEPEWSLAALARRVGLAKPTVLRILGALESEGLVLKDSENQTYRLGAGIIELGGVAQRANGLTGAARDGMREVSRLTGETASLEILVDADILTLDEFQGRHRVGISPCVGARWPAHAASTGKVLLALGPAPLPESLARGKLPRYTPRTITTAEKLKAELARVERNGYATAIEELEPGYSALAAPIRDHSGRVIAALGIGGPSSRLTPARLQSMAPSVIASADHVSQRLGWGRRKISGRAG